MLSVGSRLSNRYEILAPLGSGGMGEVYRARDSRLGRDVAIKVLPEHLVQDSQALMRFEREAKALAALSHTNILSIYDFGSENGTAYAVMELLKGETLRSHLESSKLPWKKSVEIATAIADGLSAAHSAGVIHRDLKPENVFITSDGSVKILDFGLARFETPISTTEQTSAETISPTKTGVVMGTVPYMSPEQVRGENVDPRTDIFSFGSILYEMLAGHRAFQRRTQAEIIAAILNENPLPLLETGKAIPLELDQVVKHCLEKNPDQRFQSSRDLASALKAASTGEAVIHKTLTYKISGLKWVALLVVLVILGSSIYLIKNYHKPLHSIAILPFANASTDPDTEYLSDGITDSIINSVSQLPNLKVMSRGTVFMYKGKEIDPRKIGQDLKVEAIVTGRVIQQGDNLVVRADLVNVADGTQMWGAQFNQKITDVLSVQDQISKQIADNLQLKLTGEEVRHLAKHYTEDTEAYQLFLKGQYYHFKEFTPEDYQKAIEYFEQAIEKDPNYALAYVGLARVNASMTYVGVISPQEGRKNGEAALKKAKAIDNTMGELHFVRGVFLWTFDWNWPAAENEFREALEFDPNCVECRHTYSQSLVAVGRPNDAIRLMKEAQELDPLSVDTNKDLGSILYWTHQYDQAIDQFHKTLELNPDAAQLYDFLCDVYERKGRYQEAIEAEQKYLSLLGDDASANALMEDYKSDGYQAARRRQFQAILSSYEEVSQQEYVSPILFAIIHSKLNQKDEAFKWLEKAFEERAPWLTYLNADPEFDNLRSDPRFQNLLKRIGLPPKPS